MHLESSRILRINDGLPCHLHHILVAILLGILLQSRAFAAPGDPDPTFKSGSRVNGEVLSLATLADSKVLIGGSFTTVRGASRGRIARLNGDGTVDATFDPGRGADSSVAVVFNDSNGRVWVGGAFSNFNGVVRNGLCRLNPDGTLDRGFDPGLEPGSRVGAIVAQPDGRVLVAGEFRRIAGQARNRVARFNLDGTLDFSLDAGEGPDGEVRAMAVQSDGGILLAGSFRTVHGLSRGGVARLTSTGAIDSSFVLGTGIGEEGSPATTLAVAKSGHILVGGYFKTFNGITVNGITRLDSKGGLDAGFRGEGVAGDRFESIRLQADGKILVGGARADGAMILARLEPDGNPDTTFVPAFATAGVCDAIGIQSDGRILVGGVFDPDTRISFLHRLTDAGGTDAGFVPADGPNGVLTSMASLPDGKVLVGGFFNRVNGRERSTLARLREDGSLDEGFNAGAIQGIAIDMAVQQDGRVVMTGDFTEIAGVIRNRVARLNVDGSLDKSFDPGIGANDFAYTTAIQRDGWILVGGFFTGFNGEGRSGIARLSPDGGLDAGFNPDIGFHPEWGIPVIYNLVVQPDDRILVAGAFTNVSDVACNGLARLNADGSIDRTFRTQLGAGDWVDSIVVQPDGKLVLAAASIFGPDARGQSTRLLRLNADGSRDESFKPDVGFDQSLNAIGRKVIWALQLQADGKILVGGSFPGGVVRLNPDGSRDAGFNRGTGAAELPLAPVPDTGGVWSLALAPDGRIWAAGVFTTYNDQPSAYLVRLLSDGPSAPRLQISSRGEEVVLSWSGDSFLLQEAGEVEGPYSTLKGAVSPFRFNVATGRSGAFFRLQSK